ncbi:hypothetical protein ASO14_2591 [Kurthia sp. 11kri321]|uniref:DUF4230 domain-containing protein n=1 Tax=unclassified Kurthia TaxID=2644826 RepID=UPI000745DCC6|nr:DUF4230 domain-containing protein [Kurthia sp. 11kri321]AMA64167.1 hypothetical protein ASO14_2591 [Kurthia sp. 11kri321]MCA9724566.1 DUF4230 domain-containing protein [Kurthia sp.]
MKKKLKWSLFAILLLVIVIIATVLITKYVSNHTNKQTEDAVVEKITELNELATAEAYLKVIVERENNALFGEEIGLDIPGTKQKLLVVMPGTVRAGVDLSKITKEDVQVDEEKKTIQVTAPEPQIQGKATLDLEKVQVFSTNGLFRDEATVKDGYSLANDAQKLMIKEAETAGLLKHAKTNAEQAIRNLFSALNYNTTVEFKE